MPDYKEMYLDLFRSVTDVIEQLCEAQKRAEERFLRSSQQEEERPNNLTILRLKE